MTKKPKLNVIEGGAEQKQNETLARLGFPGLPEKIFIGDELPQSEASKEADRILKELEGLAAQFGIKPPHK